MTRFISAVIATAGWLAVSPAAAQVPAPPEIPTLPPSPEPAAPAPMIEPPAEGGTAAALSVPMPNTPAADIMMRALPGFASPLPRKIVMEPGNGQLWLTSAFAFEVCKRKGVAAWNHEGCGWTEYSAGDRAAGNGRYMYEIRWPDGRVQRGAREIVPAGTDGDDQAIVFRHQR